jgi:hypothetical protein
LCQESIVQWSKRYKNELLYSTSNISLVMVSIGLPEKAMALIRHLELKELYGTHEMLFVDDINNTIYDALELNRGIQRTFFNSATPNSFLDRWLQSNNKNGEGFNDLGRVLSKWNNGTCRKSYLSRSFARDCSSHDY